MSTWYKYRVYCETDAKFEYMLAETEPTTCPANTAHTIAPTKTCIIEERITNVFKVEEERIPTGGNFGTGQIKAIAAANSTGTVSTSYPFDISALVITFTHDLSHVGNTISLCVGKNTIIGALTASVAPATAWTSQNYVVGDKVTYTDTIGNRVYTCTTNTTANQVPTNKTYWRRGYELNVSSTAISDKTMVGYYLRLDDLTNNNDMGRIVYINKTSNKIYVEYSPINSFSAVTPTYIKQTVYIMKNYELDVPWEHDIGQSKIGGANIPEDTLITLEYTNNTGTTSHITGRVEHMY